MNRKDRIAYEVVKIVEVGAIPIVRPGGAEPIRLRIEVLRRVGGRWFTTRFYRRETYRIRPTFPLKGSRPVSSPADSEILVADEFLNAAELRGASAREVLTKALARIRRACSPA